MLNTKPGVMRNKLTALLCRGGGFLESENSGVSGCGLIPFVPISLGKIPNPKLLLTAVLAVNV